MKNSYRTTGTCSRAINFEIDGKIVKNVEFVGGCAGNTNGISKLVENMDIVSLKLLMKLQKKKELV